MKKVISVILLIFVLAFSFVSCTDTSGADDQGAGTAEGSSSGSNLGDYNVVIDSCRIAEDYSGKPIVIVKYVFTNNGDDAAAFLYSVSADVFQSDIGLNECYFVADSANYSADNQSKQIRSGATLDVEVAYELNDTVSDIEIEVTEWISWTDKKVTKTFKIN